MKDDLALTMMEKLKSDEALDSSDLKLTVALKCLNKAAECFEMAGKEDLADAVTKLMEKLSSKF